MEAYTNFAEVYDTVYYTHLDVYKRQVRHGSGHLAGRKGRRPWQGDLLPQRNGRDGTSHEETVRDADRNPDGPDRGAGRMDLQNLLRK